jgi:hypothetical protein
MGKVRERERARERDREIERKTYTNKCIYIYKKVCGSYIYFMLIFIRDFHQAVFVSRREGLISMLRLWQKQQEIIIYG